jgi:excisionase family DNA binding protein
MIFKKGGVLKMSMIPTMLTINQTAERSGLAMHYIRQLCLQGKITYCRAGSKYLINFEKFVEYLNAGENPALACVGGIRNRAK